MSQQIPIHPPILTRSVECNRLQQYFELTDLKASDLIIGSTVLFEWNLNPYLSANHTNDTDKYTYQLGYVVIRDGGVKDFIYEYRFGNIKDLKKEFTYSFI